MKENQHQFHRLGIVVSQRSAATYRNRIKRLFRVLRLNKNKIMGSYDFVIRVKKGCY
jgi:ribonuclease P protein component